MEIDKKTFSKPKFERDDFTWDFNTKWFQIDPYGPNRLSIPHITDYPPFLFLDFGFPSYDKEEYLKVYDFLMLYLLWIQLEGIILWKCLA